MKALLYVAIAAVVILATVTGILARFNWNEKLAGQLVSVLVVGTATAFVTVLLSLREIEARRSFGTSLAVDSIDGLPPEIEPPQLSTKMMWRASDLARTCRAAREARSKSGSSQATTVVTDEFSYLAELIQYQIARDIRDMQSGSNFAMPVQIRRDLMIITSRLRVPKKHEGLRRVIGTQWNEAIHANRFDQGNHDRDWYDQLAVPEDVQLQLVNVSSFGANSPKDYIVRLFRDGYFDFSVRIHTVGANTGGAIPNGLHLDETVARRCSAYFFTITIDVHIEKLRSGGRLAQTYEAWLEEITDALEARWSDVGNADLP